MANGQTIGNPSTGSGGALRLPLPPIDRLITEAGGKCTVESCVELVHELGEEASALLVVLEHVVAGAGRTEQDDVPGGRDAVGDLNGLGQRIRKLHIDAT